MEQPLLIDPKQLKAYITPTRDGKWRFDITAVSNVGEDVSGDTLWRLTDVDSYGWAKDKVKAEEKARKRMAKTAKRLVNLQRPGKIINHIDNSD